MEVPIRIKVEVRLEVWLEVRFKICVKSVVRSFEGRRVSLFRRPCETISLVQHLPLFPLAPDRLLNILKQLNSFIIHG